MPTRLSTEAVIPKERSAYWNNLVSSVLGQLDTIPQQTTSFSGTISHSTIATIPLAEVASTRLRVLRPEYCIANADEDFYKVNFHIQGFGTLKQRGRTTQLQPGDWVVYDNTEPYELHFHTDYQQLLMLIPRTHLLTRLPAVESLLARPLSTSQGTGRVLLNFVRTTLHESDTIAPPVAAQMAEMLLDLLQLGIVESGRPQGCAPAMNGRPQGHAPTMNGRPQGHVPMPNLQGNAPTLAEAQQFINTQLDNEHLSVDLVAAHLHVSKRHLHTLFEQTDTTLNRYIWQQRLAQCERDLIDPRYVHQSLTQIAFRWGFKSSAHFSRLFKQRYGVSPREYRVIV
ncbi:MAG: helix-turn-helix domain-containing protein [Chloroflexota bacterium]